MLKKSLLVGLAMGLAIATGAVAQDPLKIVYIGKNTGNPYFDSITGGFEDACKAIGCEFEFVAPATAEATSQIPFIEAQIQRGVNVIGIAPNSPDALMHLTRPKLVMVDGNSELEAWWYPYGNRMTELMKVVIARQMSGGVAATLRTLGALKARMAELRNSKGN